jgi:hypothetical protein
VIGKKIWRNVRNREHNGLAGHKEWGTFVLSFWGTGMFLEKLFFDKKDREFSALQEYKFVY